MSDDSHGGGHGDGGGDHGGNGHGSGGHEGEGGLAGAAAAADEGLHAISEALGEGEDTEDARRGLDTASDAAGAVGGGARTVEGVQNTAGSFQSGDVGGGVGGLGRSTGSAADTVSSVSSGLGNVIDDPEARRVLGEVSRTARQVGQVARGVGEALDGAIDIVGGLIGEASDVDYHLAISDVEAELHVRSVGWSERLSELYGGHARAFVHEHLAERDLIGKDVHLSIERGTEQRSLRGIVSSASVRHTEREGSDGYEVSVEIVPAVYLMAQTVDSRIYQDLSVPDLVEQLVDELCGSRSRKVKKDDLTEQYPEHEYLVQHNESHIEFLQRLCAEEGIFFYFDHDADDEDHEVLVLADSNDNRPTTCESSGGRVQYSSNENHAIGHEVATGARRHERIGATDSVVTGYDWSNPGMRVKQERKDRGNWQGPPLEVHDHFANVRHHSYDDGGGQYQEHSAERQARMNTERLDLARQHWNVDTTVVTAAPGRTFSLEGTEEHDEEYLIVEVVASGHNDGVGVGNYDNSLSVIPKSMPFRPEIPRRRPMPGPETATVVGPSGEEIHTDQHGRIKVQFHWDRRGQSDEHSSAWIRVAQGWAGPGYGSIFIPRIGMEVLVQFLGGDPDRPIVTGCIYNGQNRPPYTLPDDKTKSTIKTNSSLGGGGSNELRFEDKAGSEEVYIHAQKDFNEVVENNHSTHVKNDQSNTVDHDQTEHIKNNQTMTVDKDRKKTVKGDEVTVIGPDSGNRTETVHGDEKVEIKKNRTHKVQIDDVLDVMDGKRVVNVNTGCDYETYKGGREVEVKDHDRLNVTGGAHRRVHVTGHYHTTTNQFYKVTQNNDTELYMNGMIDAKSPGDVILRSNDVSFLMLKSAGEGVFSTTQKIEIDAGSEITIKVGGNFIKISSSGIEIEGGTINISASAGNTAITAAAQVKIKCD